MPTLTRPYGRTFSNVDLFPGGFTPPYGITLPTFLNTTRPDVSAYTPTVVTTKAQLNSAYAAADAANGGLIHIAQGTSITTWTPANRTTSGWITIEVANNAGYDVLTGLVRLILPAGQRMDPTTASNLPRFLTDPANLNVSAMFFNAAVHHVRIRSIAFYHAEAVNPATSTDNLVSMSDDAHDIVLEQIHCSQGRWTNMARGVVLHAHHSAVIDSWIDAGRSLYQEAQSVVLWSNQGVVKIVNNYMNGVGECFMAGGSQPTNPSDASLTYYPKDLEFRRNFLGNQQKHWFVTTAWANYWDTTRSGLIVGSVVDNGNGLYTLNLSSGAFNTSEFSANGISYAACVTAGSAVGSGYRISSYTSTTAAILDWETGSLPVAGDTIKIVKGLIYHPKNLCETKNVRRVYFAENVFEGSWGGDNSGQPYAVIFKSVNQSSGSGIYSQTRDVCFYDNLGYGLNGGFCLARQPEAPAIDMQYVHADNSLFIGHGLRGSARRGFQINGHDYHLTRVAFYRFADIAALILPDGSLNNTDTFDRCVFAVRSNGATWQTDTISNDPTVGFPGAFDTANCSMTNSGFLDHVYPQSRYNINPYMTGNIVVTTEDAMKLVNPTTDFWGVGNWGLDITSPFSDGTGVFGVDYADLKLRTAGVRPSLTDAPLEDWQVNGITGTGGVSVGTPAANHQRLRRRCRLI